MAILTILILPIQEHGIFSHFFESSLISCISVLQFLACECFTFLIRFMPKYYFLDAIYKVIFFFFLLSLSDTTLSV